MAVLPICSFNRTAINITYYIIAAYVFLQCSVFVGGTYEVKAVGVGRDRGRFPSEVERIQTQKNFRRKQIQEALSKAKRLEVLEREYLKNISISSLEFLNVHNSSIRNNFGTNRFYSDETYRGPIDSRTKCGVREGSSGSIRRHKVVLVVSIDYLPIFFNWMLFYLHLCPNRENIFIICINKETTKEMSKYGITCSFNYDSPYRSVKSATTMAATTEAAGASARLSNGADKSTLASSFEQDLLSPNINVATPGLLPSSVSSQSTGHETIWKVRVSIAKQFLEKNFDVLICDIDAFWIRNPFPAIESTLSDITASRARFPLNIYSKFGASLCMGFVYIRASPVTQSLWNVFYKYMLMNDLSDDQEILNHLIFSRGQVEFKATANPKPTSLKSLANETSIPNFSFASNPKPLEFESSVVPDTGIFHVKKLRSSITLLAHSEFMRNCDSYKQVLTSTVAHCYAPKKGLRKELNFRYFKTWIISSNYGNSNVSKIEFQQGGQSLLNFENYLETIYSKKLYEETKYYMENHN